MCLTVYFLFSTAKIISLKLCCSGTNWISNGFESIFQQPSMFRVKCLTKNIMMSPGQYKDKESRLFLYIYCGVNETYSEFHWTKKMIVIETHKKLKILHIFRFIVS